MAAARRRALSSPKSVVVCLSMDHQPDAVDLGPDEPDAGAGRAAGEVAVGIGDLLQTCRAMQRACRPTVMAWRPGVGLPTAAGLAGRYARTDRTLRRGVGSTREGDVGQADTRRLVAQPRCLAV